MDESTDVSATKVSGVLLCYFSEKDKNIWIAFLSFTQIVEASEEQLFYKKLKNIHEEYNLYLYLCIGLATEGASNMTGEHNKFLEQSEGRGT